MSQLLASYHQFGRRLPGATATLIYSVITLLALSLLIGLGSGIIALLGLTVLLIVAFVQRISRLQEKTAAGRIEMPSRRVEDGGSFHHADAIPPSAPARNVVSDGGGFERFKI